MIDLNRELLFLTQFGIFNVAQQAIPNNPMPILQSLLEKCQQNNELEKSSLLAQKMCILYGLEGFYLYFPIQFTIIQQNKQKNEIIDQDIIKVLSLILFVEKNLSSKAPLDWIKKVKEKCLALCDADVKLEIQSEANKVCSALEQFATTTPQFS